MQFILKLLKEVLNRLSNIYKKEFVDELLSTKVSVDESEDVIDGLAISREQKDEIIQDNIDSSKSYDEALSNVIKWQSYAAAMQSMVDDETAIQIAEEFEKAAEEYLKNPSASKIWKPSPYYETTTTQPIIDFNVSECLILDNTSSLGVSSNVPVLLPNATKTSGLLLLNKVFNSPLVLPTTTYAPHLIQQTTLMDSLVWCPNVENAKRLAYAAAAFNRPLYLPKATDCTEMLYNAKLFNQPLSLPEATLCSKLLIYAYAFNSPLDLPKADNCSFLVYNCTKFNQPVSLPSATNCAGAFRGASSMNQVVSLPKASYCDELFHSAVSYNQTVLLPSCSTAARAFYNTGMSSDNISKTLDSLPKWDSGTHSIMFTGSPGAKYVDTHEPIMVEVDGEYRFFDDFPRYTTDDDNDSLRKSTASAVARGWTIEMGDPEGDDWKTYMLSKANLTREIEYVELVNQAISEYETDETALLPNRLIKDWDALYVGYETYVASCGEESQLGSDFWVEYFAALVRYLRNPTETKNWDNYKDDDGNLLSRCPYFDEPPTRPVVDFAVTSCKGTNNTRSAFSRPDTNMPIYLPSLIEGSFILSNCAIFDSPLILPEAKTLVQVVYSCDVFNNVLYAPKATSLAYAFHVTNQFNRPVFFTKAVNCNYLLGSASSFNSPVYLPKATACSRLLNSTAFNHPLVLPSATDCSYSLRECSSFNQVVYAPLATNCEGILYNAVKFNQPLSLPKATNCYILLRGAEIFDQPLSVPKAQNCDAMLYMASVFNQPLDLPECTRCDNILTHAYKFNSHVNLPKCSTAIGAFRNTALSSDNIRSILMTLPEHTDGAEHVISFVGTPGSAELDETTSEVALAKERGWTVEL